LIFDLKTGAGYFFKSQIKNLKSKIPEFLCLN